MDMKHLRVVGLAVLMVAMWSCTKDHPEPKSDGPSKQASSKTTTSKQQPEKVDPAARFQSCIEYGPRGRMSPQQARQRQSAKRSRCVSLLEEQSCTKALLGRDDDAFGACRTAYCDKFTSDKPAACSPEEIGFAEGVEFFVAALQADYALAPMPEAIVTKWREAAQASPGERSQAFLHFSTKDLRQVEELSAAQRRSWVVAMTLSNYVSPVPNLNSER